MYLPAACLIMWMILPVSLSDHFFFLHPLVAAFSFDVGLWGIHDEAKADVEIAFVSAGYPSDDGSSPPVSC